MKKYWKLITVTALIVLTLGAFYFNSSFAATKYPEFVFKHKSGDEKEIENVAISSEIIMGQTNIYAEITPEGTNYMQNISYLDLIKENHQSVLIEKLQKDHRNFMRGKSDVETQYYEDDTVLASVNLKIDYDISGYGMSDYLFEIEVLDKASNNTTKFETEIPDNERLNHVQIQRVQVMDGQIKVFSANQLEQNLDEDFIYRDELHLYNISIKNQNLVRDDVVLEVDDFDAKYSVSTNVINSNEKTRPNKDIIYTLNISEEAMTDEGFNESIMIDQQLIYYNLETNEQKKIVLPKEYDDKCYPELLSGDLIYFSKEETEGIKLIAYNIVSEKVEDEQTFSLPAEESEEMINYTFDNNKIYMMQQHETSKVDTDIMIADIKTGDTLYEGSVEVEKDSQEKYDVEMSFLELR